MQKTIKEIVEETLAFYEGDPSRRATNFFGECKYETEDGRRCAVGRCLLPEVDAKDLSGLVINLVSQKSKQQETDLVRFEDLDDLLKEEYRGHPKGFWKDLQDLHDCGPIYWNAYRSETDETRREKRRHQADSIIRAYTTNPTN